MLGKKVRITWFYFFLSTLYTIIASLIYIYSHSYFSFLFIWPSAATFYMFVACLTNNPHMLGKNRKTGKIDKIIIFALFPLFFGIWITWFFRKSLSRESVYDEIVDGIYVGKLPFFFSKSDLFSAPEKHRKNIPVNVGMIIDLTAEFNQPVSGRNYHCCLSLDALYPPESVHHDVITALKEAAAWDTKQHGGILVHCANGHGRSAMMVAMLLVVKGISRDFDEAYITIKLRRNKVNIKPHQRAAAIRLLELYKKENSVQN